MQRQRESERQECGVDRAVERVSRDVTPVLVSSILPARSSSSLRPAASTSTSTCKPSRMLQLGALLFASFILANLQHTSKVMLRPPSGRVRSGPGQIQRFPQTSSSGTTSRRMPLGLTSPTIDDGRDHGKGDQGHQGSFAINPHFRSSKSSSTLREARLETHGRDTADAFGWATGALALVPQEWRGQQKQQQQSVTLLKAHAKSVVDLDSSSSKDEAHPIAHERIDRPIDVAIGVHLDVQTLRELNYLEALRKQWPAKICLAVFVGPGEKTAEIKDRFDHRVRLFQYSTPARDYWNRESYPINQLRQLLVDRCEAEMLFHLDAGLVFSKDPFQAIERHSDQMRREANRTVFVVPAFEHCDNGCQDHKMHKVLPNDKSELGRCFAKGCCCMFKHRNTKAYGATEHSKWLERPSSSPPMPVPYHLMAEFFETYEPFVVGNPQCFPRFRDEFPYGFRNKASWHMHMRAFGAQYSVLPDVFLMHAAEEGSRDAAPQNRKELWASKRPMLLTRLAKFRYKLLASNPKPLCYRRAPGWQPMTEHDLAIMT